MDRVVCISGAPHCGVCFALLCKKRLHARDDLVLFQAPEVGKEYARKTRNPTGNTVESISAYGEPKREHKVYTAREKVTTAVGLLNQPITASQPITEESWKGGTINKLWHSRLDVDSTDTLLFGGTFYTKGLTELFLWRDGNTASKPGTPMQRQKKTKTAINL